VALRFPRPVIVTVAIALAVAWTALGSIPALADQVRQQQWWLGALHITQAQQTSNGSGVTVALLDTGVDPAQPDIAGSVITGPDFTNSGEKPGGPDYGIHGTAMASLIVGHGHGPGDADGILGVAPGARLLSVRVTLDATDPLATDSAITSGLPAAIAAGIRYAVRSGAQVIDLPLDPGQSLSALVASTAPVPAAGTPPTPAEIAEQAAAGGSAAEQAAVSFALSKGVVLVAPAGDNGTGTDAANFPASYPGVISVGAFDSNIIKAPFTSHQSYVTLTAAGSGMTAAVPGGYATVSSTSAASAVVTGIVAMIKAVYPELTPAQITQALTSSTVFRPPGGQADGSGHGTVDAARALAAATAIAKPGPPRAGAGAVPRTLPAAPAVPFIDKSLAKTLLRDALISLALLVVLLLPILAYVLVRRRRARARTVPRAERELGARSAYVPPSSSHADEMLEYFAAMPTPAGARSARPSEGSAAPGWGGLPGPGGPADTNPGAGNGAPAGRLPLTPTSRPAAHRTPTKVSGTPPWEPAAKPDSELPWVARPTPSFRGERAPAAPPAPPSPAVPPASAAPWAARADAPAPASADADADAPPAAAGPQNPPPVQDSVWDPRPAADVPEPAAEPPTPPSPQADQGGRAGENGWPDEDAEPDGGPIFVWNPGASTETLPSLPRAPRDDG
jgi:subtilisin family serine protease